MAELGADTMRRMSLREGEGENTPTASATTTLFDRDFLAKLQRLEFVARKLFRTGRRGEHAANRRGRGLDFADFRRYRPGDDLRHIDWSVYLRLRQLFVKLYTNEEQVPISLLIDCSQSMGVDDHVKFDYARRVGAALGYVALGTLDEVQVVGFTDSCTRMASALRSRHQVRELFQRLDTLSCQGNTDFEAAVDEFISQRPKRGIAVVISDFLGASVATAGLERLRWHGFEASVIQTLSESDLEPGFVGAQQLIDSETGNTVDLTVDEALLVRYREKLAGQVTALRSYSARNGIDFFSVSTVTPFEELVLRFLRATGASH